MKFLSKKLIKALLLGLIVFAILSLVFNFLFFLSARFILQPGEGVHKVSSSEELTLFIFNLIARLIMWLEVVVAGGVTAWVMKSKGWLYGGLLGVLFVCILLVITLLTLLLPVSLHYGSDLPLKIAYQLTQGNIFNQIINVPLIILLSSLGGWLSEKFYRRSFKGKVS